MDTASVLDSRARDKAARIGQACLRCQSKKIKCDGKQPSCTPCTNRSHDCQYQQVQRRRGPGRRYVAALLRNLIFAYLK
ncbi:Transcriptional activator protein acu-15 [Colletotrichum gloeosporioides]|uniref:Transcriptional activator protein acu-15 n=1 Tax=Colletotrichum gloeosporioides TaxID=474922 RepID=A0A8H4FE29_COLGL|nr:Transcriptional activator protein acu-15 [Colletotrichum gloeosporioides]KAF3798933.1 Transcriptional activator protein acu-15 [Colletotrichum gloeosporioides]